jgi:hypothetical protein
MAVRKYKNSKAIWRGREEKKRGKKRGKKSSGEIEEEIQGEGASSLEHDLPMRSRCTCKKSSRVKSSYS